MKYTREQYEKMINESILFQIDKEKDSALFNQEKYTLMNLLLELYRYYIYVNRPLDNYSMELVESANECIKHYDSSIGKPFLNLFNYVMKRNMYISNAKKAMDKHRRGIVLSRDDNKSIKIIINYVESKGSDLNSQETHKQLAKVLNISVNEVQNLIRINQNAITVSSTVTNDDGEEVELYDIQSKKDDSPEDIALQLDNARQIALSIDAVYKNQQNRAGTKKLLSKLLTKDFIKSIYDLEQLKVILKGVSFVDEEIIKNHLKENSIPSAKQIASESGISEQSASRTYRNFLEKFKKKC